jgi:sigma-B regulation protein RsbU (phosphoserine phosphatase)
MSFIEPFFKEMAKAQAALRLERERLSSIVHETEEELRLAQRIQRQLLPSRVPELPHLDVYGRSDPAVWTSGDYFDYLTLQDGSTAIIVADVSGHGLGPALLMSSTRASFRGLAPTTSDIGELLSSGNRAVADSVASSEFVTAMVVRYDSEDHALSYAGAGHVAYLMRADGSWQTLGADSPPLGIVPDMKVEADLVADVVPGDIVVIVTDGILEIENSSGQMFGEARLMEHARRYADESARKIVEALMSASRKFAGDEPQRDDVTAVVIKVT